MRRISSILFALVLVVSVGLSITTPVVAEPGTTCYVSTTGDDDTGDGTVGNPWRTIQKAIDALNVTEDGATIMVAAGEYDDFVVADKNDIDIIGTEGTTITTASLHWIEEGSIEDAWVMAGAYRSENINIEGIDFDGTAISGEVVIGINYVDSTGRIAGLTVENISGTELGMGVAIIDKEGTSTVEIIGSSITNNGIGIFVLSDSSQEAHFNNIVGNSDSGVVNAAEEPVDATYNWWGDASGPFAPLKLHFGSGDAVSDFVDFEPWLESASVTKMVTNGIVDAIDYAAAKVEVDNGTAMVTISKYAGNPYPEIPIEGETELSSLSVGTLQTDRVAIEDSFLDLYVPYWTPGTIVTIKIYYTDDQIGDVDEADLLACWANEDEYGNPPEYYLQCHPSYVNDDDQFDINGHDYSGYIVAIVRDNGTTSPRMDQLDGTTFGGYGSGGTSPQQGCGGCFIATAAYGTDTAGQLDILRAFRDAILLRSSLGTKLVSFYYRTSPPIANFIARHEVLRTIVRVGFIDRLVRALSWTHNLWSG